MVKIVFSDRKDKKAELDVDVNVTVEEMKEILVSKHSFPDGVFRFIYKGKILQNPTPFKDVKEKDQVIVFIKAKQQQTQPPAAETAPKAENAPKPQVQPPQRQPTPRPAVHNPQRPQTQPQQPQRPNQQVSREADLNREFNNLVASLHLENLYKPENQFWENTSKIAEISEIINQNPSLLQELIAQLDAELIPNVYVPYINNTILLLHDVLQSDFLPCQSDFDAKYDSLSKAQKTIFDELLRKYNDKEKVMDALESTSFNKDEAIKKLSSN